MYVTTKRVKQFELSGKGDAQEYESILNNPLCSILAQKSEKLTTKHFNDEGVPIAQEDRLVLLVTWEEKSLL